MIQWKRVRPCRSVALLLSVQKRYGVQFPPAYVALVRQYNEGIPDQKLIDCDGQERIFSRLLSIDPAVHPNIADAAGINSEADQLLLPFAFDPFGNYFAMLFEEDSFRSIVFLDMETGETAQAASSIEELLDALHPDKPARGHAAPTGKPAAAEEKTIALTLRTPRKTDWIRIWYYLWQQLPFFRNVRTEIRTASMIEDGYHQLPAGLPPEIFEALIRDVHPTSFICRAGDLTAQLVPDSGTLYLSASSADAASMLASVRSQLMKMPAPAPLEPIAIDFDHRFVKDSMNSPFWVENMVGAFHRLGFPYCWLNAGEGTLRHDDLLQAKDAGPDLLAAWQGNQFMVYDFVNDRLIGAGVRHPLI